jgi:hypothetical protein
VAAVPAIAARSGPLQIDGARDRVCAWTVLQSKYTNYLVAGAAFSFGLVVIGFTAWIERRRQKN